MSTKFIEILAEQRPFGIGLDPQKRNRFSVNFNAMAQAPVVAWEECVVKILVDAGLGTANSDIFVGDAVVLPPTGTGPYITVIDTGGTSPVHVRNSSGYERLSVQLIVTAASYAAGRTRALAAWRALDGIRNATVAA